MKGRALLNAEGAEIAEVRRACNGRSLLFLSANLCVLCALCVGEINLMLESRAMKGRALLNAEGAEIAEVRRACNGRSLLFLSANLCVLCALCVEGSAYLR